LPTAATNAYTVVFDKTAMADAVDAGARKLLGLFANGQLTPEFQAASRPPGQPRLPEMTAAALAILEKHRTGFFLMIEGSLVDSGNHAENIDFQFGEMVAFNESVQLVRDWINASRERKEHTLLVVLPDHETGGFAIEGTEAPGGEPLGFFVPAWAFPPISPSFPEAHHTGTDQLIWSSGPGSEALGRAIDNTFVYQVVKAVME
jgi:alkaline phosphatase